MPHATDLRVRDRRLCFSVPGRLRLAPETPDWRIALGDRPAAGLAVLLPILGCGEEAAALAFDELAHLHGKDDPLAVALTHIAHEERVHDALIARLQRGLPDVPIAPPPLAATRRFHVGLARGGPAFHLARIAALDSAVCTILGRLMRRGRPLAGDHAVAPILDHIRRDEARHVRLSRGLARDAAPGPAMRDAAAAARAALAHLLSFAGDAFEDLGVDAGQLDRDIRALPNGLLAA